MNASHDTEPYECTTVRPNYTAERRGLKNLTGSEHVSKAGSLKLTTSYSSSDTTVNGNHYVEPYKINIKQAQLICEQQFSALLQLSALGAVSTVEASVTGVAAPEPSPAVAAGPGVKGALFTLLRDHYILVSAQHK